jgi:surfactin synthase thioesterase subunit
MEPMDTPDASPVVEDRPRITLVCLSDGPATEAVYRDWSGLQPGFDMLVVSWPDGSVTGHGRLLETLATLDGPFAVFGHGAFARWVPALAAPTDTPPPIHIFLATPCPPGWRAAPAGSAAVSLTLLVTATPPESTLGAARWRSHWDGAFQVRVFDAEPNFLTARAAEVVSLIEEELLVLRPIVDATLLATNDPFA